VYYTENLAKAISIATIAHMAQTRWGGTPYIVHPTRVMLRVLHLGELFAIVAILHDVVEDQDVSIETIRDIFGHDIANAVDAISRRDGEKYCDFILRCKANRLSKEVKLADIEDNLRSAEGQMESLVKRYKKAQVILNARRC